MSTVSGGAALVGRADELNRLRECCRGVSEGTGTLVLIDGDAGAGKTRLLAEVMKAPFLPRGYAAVCAGALDYARAPYAPIRDLLAALDKRFPKVLQNNRGLAGELQPVLDLRPAAEEASDPVQQRRLLDAIVRAISLYAAQSPVMLALEDVHWIDSASADVLLHLSRAISAMRALLVVSFRPAEAREDERAQHLLAQLSRSAALSLSLKPLSPADAMLLIDDIAGPALSMDARRSICKLADGNPLLLIEFAKVAAENPDALRGSLPLSLKALVAERLARFDSGDVDVLRVAAIMGEFDPRTLGEIAGMEPARVAATLRKARAASIVGEQPTKGAPFVFRHALIRHAITDDLLAFETEQLHARIAERLERDEPTPKTHSRLAHHYFNAGNEQKSQHYNEISGHEALRMYAYADAALFFERAIGSRGLNDETWPLFERLADAYVNAQRTADAVRVTENLFKAALENGDQLRIASTGFELSRRTYRMLDDEGSITTVRRALEAVDAAAHPEQAFNLRATLAWYLAHLRRLEEAAPALGSARALFERGTPDARVRYYEASAAYKVHANQVATYRDDANAALAIVREQNEPLRLARALDNAIGLSMASNLDDLQFALQCCEELWAIAKRVPVQPFAITLALSAWVAYLRGDLLRARDALNMAFPAAEEAPLVGFYIARAGIPVALRLGDTLLLRRTSRPRLLQQAFASTTANVFGPIAAAVAEHLRSQGRAGEAVVLVAQAIRRLSDGANNVPLIVEAARLNAADARERGLAMLAEMQTSVSAKGGWHLAKAYAANGRERREHALLAAQTFGRIPWPLFQAEALEIAGEKQAALEIYRTCGAAAEVSRIEGREAQRSRTALSRREWDVATLVASGKSNKAIAADLSLSERTVENHVASVFTKLNLRSRAEIAAHMTREAVKAE